MKEFELNLTQLDGRLSLHLFRDHEDKEPLFYSRSIAPSRWNVARQNLLINALRDIADKLEKEQDET